MKPLGEFSCHSNKKPFYAAFKCAVQNYSSVNIVDEIVGITPSLPSTLEPQYNGALGITNDILQPGLLTCMEQNLDITNPRYKEPVSPVPWHVKSRFHCN